MSTVEPGSGARALRADARRNRVRVLAAAEEVLAAEGVSAPIDEIARRAGVGVGTVYRHFPTKEALLEAIVAGRMQRLFALVEASAEEPDAGTAFFGCLHAMYEEGARHVALADALARAGISIASPSADAKGELERVLGVQLARAQAAGAVRADVAVQDVLSLLAGTCMAAERGADPARLQRLVGIVCDGLRPGAA
jgi:AcrR family transcriptional regulator